MKYSAMPWKCPACGTQIRHSEVEAKPRRDGRYRCHICRLELVLDPATDHLAAAPFPSDDSQQPRLQTEQTTQASQPRK